MSTYRDRVQNGIAFLDEKLGTEWPNRIDLELLDIGYGKHCIVGQLFGDYYDGLRELTLKPKDEAPWEGTSLEGIETHYGFWTNSLRNGVLHLTNAWKAELKARKSEQS